MSLSRRDFLKLCGITLGASTLLDAGIRLGAWSSDIAYARTFKTTTVYAAPEGKAVGKLFPDSLVQLSRYEDAWLKTEHGYLKRHAVQPMPTWSQNNLLPAALPSLIEVAAPSVPIYTNCDDTSEIIARIGHGGVMYAVDYLPEERYGWFAVGHDADEIVGWTRAERWNAIANPQTSAVIDSIRIDRALNQMIAFNHTEEVARFDSVFSPSFAAGWYELEAQRPTTQQSEYSGVSWSTLWTGPVQINGAYWHNQFGQQTNQIRENVIEISPIAAAWLYRHLAPTAKLHTL